MLNPADLARIESLENQLSRLLLAVQFQQAASRNRAFSSPAGGTTPTSVTAGMTLNYAAVTMVSQASGIFDVSIQMDWSGATTGDTGTFGMTTQTGTGVIALANATAIGGVAGPVPGVWAGTAAGGITVTTGGGGSVTQGPIAALPALTGELKGTLVWRGLVHEGGGGAFTRFTLGNNVIFLFSLNSTNSWTLAPPTISVIELS